MTTISEAQNRLEDVLTNEIGEDLPKAVDSWDMEDWTVYALNYLADNIHDALEYFEDDNDEDIDIPERMKKGSALWNMIFDAMKITGNFDDAFRYIEENLTQEEFIEIDDFFGWCQTNKHTFGHGNYWQVYKKYREDKESE